MPVQTVLGERTSEELGITLTHEHFSLDFSKYYREPPAFLRTRFAALGQLSLNNLALVRQYPYSWRENLLFLGEEVEKGVTEDCRTFRQAGGGTVVENTSWGLGRDTAALVRISKAAGINVIAGTGHYTEETQKSSTLSLKTEELCQIYLRELREGCLDLPEVRCGVIAEVGSSWPITGFERRCIEATGAAQREAGCGVSFHPGRHHEAPAEILRHFSEAGGRTSRAVISHLERTLRSAEELLELGDDWPDVFLQMDLFGTETSYYQLAPERDMPSDAQRLAWLQALITDGKAARALFSHDIHTRHRLTCFGGHGYAHIPVQVVEQMKAKGVSEEIIHQVLVSNPAAWLTGQRPSTPLNLKT